MLSGKCKILPGRQYSFRLTQGAALECRTSRDALPLDGRDPLPARSRPTPISYRAPILVARNDFTTIWFGCIPTGIIVSSEYSEGSNFFRGVRF